MTEYAELAKRLRALHDRLQTRVSSYGKFKDLNDRDGECGIASHECWKAADAIEVLEKELVHMSAEGNRESQYVVDAINEGGKQQDRAIKAEAERDRAVELLKESPISIGIEAWLVARADLLRELGEGG